MGQTVRVTRAEAEERARRLQENDADRAARRFVARERGEDDWEVASVEVPAQLRRGLLTR